MRIMSNTEQITIDALVWAEIAPAGSTGFITNEGGQKFKYRESDILPVDEIGHTLELEVGAFVAFKLVGAQKVYAKAVAEKTTLAITFE